MEIMQMLTVTDYLALFYSLLPAVKYHPAKETLVTNAVDSDFHLADTSMYRKKTKKLLQCNAE